ncbi:hypothetical protein [Anaerovorax sp. IOR16]|uniref:hypothetical protein n=1 Tax=Anaerovorax sp. IOR16 TaxID=2773458 RepID=UPI0019D24D8D|nr:hypothetical protein [Anaerovorax sp. IOR16]
MPVRMMSVEDAIDLLRNKLSKAEDMIIIDVRDGELYKPNEQSNMTFGDLIEWVARDTAVVLIRE